MTNNNEQAKIIDKKLLIKDKNSILEQCHIQVFYCAQFIQVSTIPS